mgnify:CR=1 FL=1|jgi:hypothetical protein
MHELSVAMLSGSNDGSEKGTMMMINEGESMFKQHKSSVNIDRTSSKEYHKNAKTSLTFQDKKD